MTLSVRPRPYIIPEYSLTGDLLAFLTCPLQYRYYNKAALPPSTPVQLWFGEFIHGVMEEAYQEWRRNDSHQRFPWSWLPDIREIEMRVHERLQARGLYPPPRLFCPYSATTTSPGLCADADHPHQLIASHRTVGAINTWGQHLFPLISEAEVRLKGSRPMPNYEAGISRSNYYAITGIVDVISSINLYTAPPGNLLLHSLRDAPDVARIVDAIGTAGYDIIIDYKGMRRPSIDQPIWRHHEWQVITYAWLRMRRESVQPTAAAVLLYINELYPSIEDLRQLQGEVDADITDIVPSGSDLAALRAWDQNSPPPTLSQQLREERSIRIVPVDPDAMVASLQNFDHVVGDIELGVLAETAGARIQQCWSPNPAVRTCTACDFKTFCTAAAGGPYHPTVP